MNNDEIAALTVTDALSALAAGKLTSVAYVQALFDRIDAHNAPINAIITLNREGALKEADRLDKLRASGKLVGPLHGVPILIKDNINVAGILCTGATPGLREYNNVPTKSNQTVQRLLDAGVIVLGKTNLSELACSYNTANTSFAGVCHNPYNYDRITGGSSGGSGASVACGFAPVALLTDTFGSTRCPAFCNGIYGFRPTWGRYPTDGVIPLVAMFDTIGPGVRCAADLELMDGVMSGGDNAVVKVEAKGLRVGVPKKFFYENLTPDAEKAMASALAKLEAAGVTLVTVEPAGDVSGNFEEMLALGTETFVDDLTNYLAPLIADPGNPFKQNWTGTELVAQVHNPVSKHIMEAESTPAPKEMLDGLKAKRVAQNKMMTEYFASNKLDCVFYPAAGQTAPAIADGDMGGIGVFKGRFNVAPFNSLPASAIPVAIAAGDGMPFGAEILGAPESNRKVLAITKLFEGIIGHIAPPTLK